MPGVRFLAVCIFFDLDANTLKSLRFSCYFCVVAIACGGGSVVVAPALWLLRRFCGCGGGSVAVAVVVAGTKPF